MRNGLSEQIAVLDGLEVIDPTGGANFTGGSSYAPGLPLMPSTVGLADADLLEYMGSGIPGVLPAKSGVINPGGGALYVGGSSWTPGLPVMPGTGLAGCGAGGALSDLTCMSKKLQGLGVIDASDGGNYSGGSSYAPGLPLMPSTVGLASIGVVDPSEGGNYSGGSSYAPGLPLMPSTVGLAALMEVDGLDGLDDATFYRKLKMNARPLFKAVAGKSALSRLKKEAKKISAVARVAPPQKRARLMQRLRDIGTRLFQARKVRRTVMQQMRPMTSPTFQASVQSIASRVARAI